MLSVRTLSLALLATAALGVSACGGDDSGGGGDDESQIRAVVSDYAAAIADQDGDKACGFLTDQARESVEAAGRSLQADGCADVMEKVLEQTSEADRDDLKDIEVVSVEIDGDRATVRVKAGGDEGDPSTLVKEDGDWKIAVDQDSGGANSATVESSTATTP